MPSSGYCPTLAQIVHQVVRPGSNGARWTRRLAAVGQPVGRLAGSARPNPVYAKLHGRPRPVDDSWIAACCLVRELPLAMLNIEDYADFAKHEGDLELVR